MKTELPPWRIERSPMFGATHLIGNRLRSFAVWPWAGRLAFRDLDLGLWWVTEDLQPHDPQLHDPRAFWQHALETRRVMRVFEAQGSLHAVSNSGVEMRFDLRECDVLVREDNSGLARVAVSADWLSFPPTSPRRPLRRPLAWKPIWSQRFRLDLARRSLHAMARDLGQQKVEALPSPVREVWREGVWSSELAPIRAAWSRGWRPRAVRRASVAEFWSAVSTQKLGRPLHAIDNGPEMEIGGEIVLLGPFARREVPAIWEWQQGEVVLRCSLVPSYDSQHELLEASLALRAFLTRFFPEGEVKKLLAQ